MNSGIVLLSESERESRVSNALFVWNPKNFLLHELLIFEHSNNETFEDF